MGGGANIGPYWSPPNPHPHPWRQQKSPVRGQINDKKHFDFFHDFDGKGQNHSRPGYWVSSIGCCDVCEDQVSELGSFPFRFLGPR